MSYECLLTLNDEWELVWRRNMNFAAWIFVANRVILVVTFVDLFMSVAGPAVSRLVLYRSQDSSTHV